jgi:hypothetical protein
VRLNDTACAVDPVPVIHETESRVSAQYRGVQVFDSHLEIAAVVADVGIDIPATESIEVAVVDYVVEVIAEGVSCVLIHIYTHNTTGPFKRNSKMSSM